MNDEKAIKKTMNSSKGEMIKRLQTASLNSVAVSLSDAGLISHQLHKELEHEKNREDKARKIVLNLVDQVDNDPAEKFSQLLEVLEQYGDLDKLVQFLKRKYTDNCSESVTSTPVTAKRTNTGERKTSTRKAAAEGGKVVIDQIGEGESSNTLIDESLRRRLNLPASTSGILGDGDLIVVCNAIFNAKVKWYQIGLLLKVDIDALESIKDEEKDNSERLLRMLKYWLRTGTNRSWEGLDKALRHKTVARPDVADKLPHVSKKLEVEDVCRHFINTKKTLKMLFLKTLFSGPPRIGKTTACRRLKKQIADLISAGEADKIHRSTGAVESGSNMIVKKISSSTTLVTKAEWYEANSHTDEARLLLQQLLQIMKTENDESTATTTSTSTPAANKVDTRTKGEATAATPTTIPQVGRSEPVDGIQPIIDLLKKASEQPEFLEEMQHHFRAFLRMEDTGGQPELMDMLPALTTGPGLYLVFFNLEWNLKKEFEVFYQHESGKTSTPEKSKITLEEMLLSILSSISCSSTSANLLKDEEINNSDDMRKIFKSSKSVAYLVGTHKDKVSDEHIKKLDEDLQNIIRGTDFFDKKVVRFWAKDKLIVTMDNMKGGFEEVNAIRKMLDKAMENFFEPLRIPAAWLLFNLCLTQMRKRTADITDVLELSRQLNMSDKETKAALWFLHHHAGVLMHFPDLPELQDLVILDTQVVYDSVTFLILEAMSFDSVGQARSEEFKKTGQFVLKDLVAATSRDIIRPEELTALLEFLHIIARIPGVECPQSSTEEQEAVYLMPCVLHIASKKELDVICDDPHQWVAPLMVRYKCGFVPLGIFPALIASLISNKYFSLVPRGMMKTKVQFRTQWETLISFLCYPRFYAIVISELFVSKHEVHKECAAIRQQVVAALEQVSSHMNYGNFVDYQFAFECPRHRGKEHLCVVKEQSEVTKLMDCLEDLDNRIPEKMESVHTVWWCEPQPQSPEPVATSSIKGRSKQGRSKQARSKQGRSKQASTTEDSDEEPSLEIDDDDDGYDDSEGEVSPPPKKQRLAEKGGVVKKLPQATPAAEAAASEVMASPGTQGDDDTDVPKVTEILKTDAMKKRYLSKKAKLTKKGLQKLDEEIKSDQHVRLVAEKLRNWEKKADLLDLSLQDVSDLKGQYGGNPCNCRIQALLKWKDKSLEPSYHCLLCICIAAEWTDSANVIIELLEKGDEEFLETKELKQRYVKYLKKIPAEKHPKLENEISSEEHLRRISSKLIEWEGKPDLLEIERAEVQDIRDLGDSAMERKEALEVWRNRAVSPTYHRLLRICIAGTWKDAADEIVQVFTS